MTAQPPPRPKADAWAIVLGVLLVAAAPVFGFGMAVLGFFAAFAGASVTIDAVSAVPLVVEVAQRLLTSLAYALMFVASWSGFAVLLALGLRCFRRARTAKTPRSSALTGLLWAWGFAVPFPTALGFGFAALVAWPGGGAGAALEDSVGPMAGVGFDNAAFGLVAGGTWVVLTVLGLTLAIVQTTRYIRMRRARSADTA